MLAVHEHIRSVVAALSHPEWVALADHGERVGHLQAALPAAVWQKVQTAVATKYHDLEGRYGRPTAVAIVATAILGLAVPLPGASVLAAAPLVGLAELHHRLSTMAEPPAGLEGQAGLAESEIRALAQRWLEELVKLIEPRTA